mmetsp:Transcript_119419/g.315727  ORF Transcript_119419/g.315727 Transcript_119419/m.315727 type:complete len:354 (-) Transcript_119419:451-1512(-)
MARRRHLPQHRRQGRDGRRPPALRPGSELGGQHEPGQGAGAAGAAEAEARGRAELGRPDRAGGDPRHVAPGRTADGVLLRTPGRARRQPEPASGPGPAAGGGGAVRGPRAGRVPGEAERDGAGGGAGGPDLREPGGPDGGARPGGERPGHQGRLREDGGRRPSHRGADRRRPRLRQGARGLLGQGARAPGGAAPEPGPRGEGAPVRGHVPRRGPRGDGHGAVRVDQRPRGPLDQHAHAVEQRVLRVPGRQGVGAVDRPRRALPVAPAGPAGGPPHAPHVRHGAAGRPGVPALGGGVRAEHDRPRRGLRRGVAQPDDGRGRLVVPQAVRPAGPPARGPRRPLAHAGHGHGGRRR